MKLQALLLLLAAPLLPSCGTSASYQQRQADIDNGSLKAIQKQQQQSFERVDKYAAYEVEKRDVGRKVTYFHGEYLDQSDLPVSVMTCQVNLHSSRSKAEKKFLTSKHTRRSNADYVIWYPLYSKSRRAFHGTICYVYRITDADPGFRYEKKNSVITGFSTQAAAESGLQVGDRIVSYNGAPLASLDLNGLQAIMMSLKPGDPVTLEVKRNGWEKLVFEFPAGENEPTHLTIRETAIF